LYSNQLNQFNLLLLWNRRLVGLLGFAGRGHRS
jgi:hypothetical protein